MNDSCVLFLPSSGEQSYRWLRVAGGAISARGEGVPTFDAQLDEVTRIAVVPAEEVTLHWAVLPDRSTAQAVAAARLLVAEASATPLDQLHVAVGHEEGGAERPIGVISRDRMQGWLAALAGQGIDPAAMIPAPMLLPRPDQGFVRGDLGGERVVRGPTTGFADEPLLTPLITGGEIPVQLDRDAMEAAILAAIAAPPLDLRQGIYARKRRRGIDWSLVRRLAWLGVAILSVSLAISLIEIAKYSIAADMLEQRADVLARQGLPRGETVNDADRQLDARLARLRGAGMGFSTTAAAVFAAIRAVPGTELHALSFDPGGALRVTLNAQGEGQVTDVKSRIEAQGFRVAMGVTQVGGGRATSEMTVTPR